MSGSKYSLGEYRKRVVVEENMADPSASDHRNEYRELPDKWQGVGTRLGRVEPLSGREFWQAQQANASTSHKLNFRFVPGLTVTRHRLRIGNRIFAIESAIDLGDQHFEHECQCTERELKKGEQA